MLRDLLVPLSLVTVAVVACVPKRDLAPDQIEKLTKLDEVMDVQATISDPQFKKIGAEGYSDADWAAFADMASRLQVTSRKIHQFTKGPAFDALADALHARAEALAQSVAAKDTKATSAGLAAIKATCKECHTKFR